MLPNKKIEYYFEKNLLYLPCIILWKCNIEIFTYQRLTSFNPSVKMAKNRKLASQIAKYTSSAENALFFSCGVINTLIDIKVPIMPNKDTMVRTTPSTRNLVQSTSMDK